MSTADTTSETNAPEVPRPAAFRWRAFGIHLGISLTILGILLFILFEFWFPRLPVRH